MMSAELMPLDEYRKQRMVSMDEVEANKGEGK